MKIKANLDNRSKRDYAKNDDDGWNKLLREANLTYKQQLLVGRYVDSLLDTKIKEVEVNATKAYMIAARIEYLFGKERLLRLNRRAVKIVNEAYGKSCVDANGNVVKYDGCGPEYLDQLMEQVGINYIKGGKDVN